MVAAAVVVVVVVVVVSGVGGGDVGGGDVSEGDVGLLFFFADRTARNVQAVCRTSIAAFFPPLSPSLPGFHTQSYEV